MKHIIYFLVVFGALLAHAQEMDTTFFVNEQGQTIGIVKPKEEQPAPAPAPVAVQQPQQNTDGSSWNSSPFEKPVQQQSAASYGTQARPAAYYAFDSTFYYQDKIDRFTKSGESKRSTGSGLMIGGAIGTAVGIALMVAGADEMECEEHYNGYSYEETCDDGAGTFVAGASIELSCDGPIREPYTAYMQGGLTYSHGRIAMAEALKRMIQNGSIPSESA